MVSIYDSSPARSPLPAVVSLKKLLDAGTADAARTKAAGSIIVYGQVLHEDTLADAVAFFNRIGHIVRIVVGDHNMAFIVFIIVVVAVDDARAVGQHEALFKGQAGADENRQVFIAFHESLKARRDDGHGMRRQHRRFSGFQIVAGTLGRLANGNMDVTVFVGRDDFKTSCYSGCIQDGQTKKAFQLKRLIILRAMKPV